MSRKNEQLQKTTDAQNVILQNCTNSRKFIDNYIWESYVVILLVKEANKKRVYERWEDDDGNLHTTYYSDFEWYLTYNFYTHDSIKNMLEDIKDTINALSSGVETDYIRKLRENRTFDAKHELIVDFYRRFIYRMEYMIQIGK